MTNKVHGNGNGEDLLLSLMASGQFLNTVPAGVLLQDANGAIIGFNDEAYEILGMTREELASRHPSRPTNDVVREDYSPFPYEERPANFTLRTGEPSTGVILGTQDLHRAQRWVMTNACRVDLDDGSSGVLSTFIDVTPRLRSRRMLELLTAVNHVMMFAEDESLCLEQLCNALVEKGHYPLAWIGVISSTEPGGVDISHSHGSTDYLYEGMVSWWGSKESGLGPTGVALRTGTTQVRNNLSSDEEFAPWRDRALQFHLGSSIAVPFALGRLRAVLNVYDKCPFAFDDATVKRLEGITREIEFGLAHIRTTLKTQEALEEATRANQALLAAELSLTESSQWFRTLVANSSDLIIVLDAEASLIYANPAAAVLTGYAPEARIGRIVDEMIHPDDRSSAETVFAEALARPGTGQPFVLRLETSSGEFRFIEVVLTNCLDDPAIRGIVANGRDVTEQTHLSRALQTLTRANQVLIHASDETSLVAETCQAIVGAGGYRLAWVAYAEPPEQHLIRPVASAGEVELLNEPSFHWDDSDSGQGPTAKSVRTGQVQVVTDVQSSKELSPWHALAEKYDIRTVCAIPLFVENQVIGSLTIYAREIGSFGPAEVASLEELGNDLAYGIGRLRDVERLVRSEAMLRDAEQRFRLAFEHNTAPMVFSDLEDRVIAVNPAFCRMIGFSEEELMGHDSKQFTYPDDVGITEETLVRLNADEVDQVRYVKRYLRKDGRIIISEVTRSPARDDSGETLYFVASERDITEERALAAQLTHQALHDPLTGLANRALFEDRLAQAHARVVRQGGLSAVLLLDIDDFKGVNDTYGHLVGDQLLQGIARRFESVTRSSDSLSRFGGDEFLYLAEGLSSPHEAEEVAARLLDVLNLPFSIDGVNFEQRASVGMVIWDKSVVDSSELIQNADVALYEAKREGKSKYVVFTPSMHQDVVSRFTLVQELRRALHSGEVSMHYQPIIDLDSTRVVGFEALMRWWHPERGWVPPSAFIPLAEQNELILELGAFALHEAVKTASTWTTDDPSGEAPYVTVNLSAHQFQDPNLVSIIKEALHLYSLAPQRLVIEITESVTLLDAVETLHVLEQFLHLGVDIALDDFGTGYSSLSYLVRLRPRIIKIDRYFVSPSISSEQNDTLLEMIVSLGNKLGITMVAEGIETEVQLERLRALKCELGQGYLFSPAVPAERAALMVGKQLRD